MPQEQSSRGGETILAVEDSPLVRKLIREVLEIHGYRVYEAPTASAALDLVAQPGVRIDLLLTDVNLPGMNGRALAEALRARQTNLKVVFASGHDRDAVGTDGTEAPARFLEKPFSPKVLAATVRAVLDSA